MWELFECSQALSQDGLSIEETVKMVELLLDPLGASPDSRSRADSLIGNRSERHCCYHSGKLPMQILMIDIKNDCISIMSITCNHQQKLMVSKKKHMFHEHPFLPP